MRPGTPPCGLGKVPSPLRASVSVSEASSCRRLWCGGSFCPRPLLSALSKRQAMAPGASHSTSAASSNQGEQGAAQP